MYKKNVTVREDYRLINSLVKTKKDLFRFHDIPLLFVPQENILSSEISKIYDKYHIQWNSTLEGLSSRIEDKVIEDEIKHSNILFKTNVSLKDCIAVINVLRSKKKQHDMGKTTFSVVETDLKPFKKIFYTDIIDLYEKVERSVLNPNIASSTKYKSHKVEKLTPIVESIFFTLDEFPEKHFLFLEYLNKDALDTHVLQEVFINKDTIELHNYQKDMLQHKAIPVLKFNRDVNTLSSTVTNLYTGQTLINIPDAPAKLTSTLFYLTACVEAYHNNDMYIVKKENHNVTTPHKKKHKRKGSGSNQKPMTTLIFLNAIPDTSDSVKNRIKTNGKGGTHASPKPHKRKGYFRTLRNIKYKYHPKYGIENGIYVRPAFVGCKHNIIDNVEYTLL